jgi:hypothetical protein
MFGKAEEAIGPLVPGSSEKSSRSAMKGGDLSEVIENGRQQEKDLSRAQFLISE